MNTLNALCKTYIETDSISGKVDLEEKILDIVKAYVDDVVFLYKKYQVDVKVFENFMRSDYRSTSGSLSIDYVCSKCGRDCRVFFFISPNI